MPCKGNSTPAVGEVNAKGVHVTYGNDDINIGTT